MGRLYYFSICAWIVLGVMLWLTRYLGLHRSKVNAEYTQLVRVCFWTCFFDLLANAKMSMLGPLSSSTVFRTIMATMYFFLKTLVLPAYIHLISAVAGTWVKTNKDPLFRIIMYIPLTLNYLLFFWNLIQPGVIFYYDSSVQYQRGPYADLMYLFGIYFLIVSVVTMLHNRRYLTKIQRTALFAIYPLNFLAAFMQWYDPRLLLEMFAFGISMLILMVLLLRPTQTIDGNTMMKKYRTFLEDVQRSGNSDISCYVVLLKLRNYNSIRRLLGKQRNAKLLEQIAEIIRNKQTLERIHIREHYFLDDGTFACTYEGKDAEEDAKQDAERIYEILSQPLHFNGIELDLMPCMCIVHLPDDGFSNSDFGFFIDNYSKMMTTDRPMMLSDMDTSVQKVLHYNTDTIIEDALANDWFQVWYQPIWSIHEKKFVSAEALVRLIDPVRGSIPPGIFIPYAEKNGMITEIGELVLQKSCDLYANSHLADLGVQYIEVNLSPVQCLQKDLMQVIDECLKRNGLTPSMLNIEITETSDNYVQQLLKETVTQLHEKGFTFSLDDYGTGNSNLQRIASFPFHILKLDKSFVDHYEDERVETILENSIDLARRLGMKTVVEGVETAEEVEWFARHGCDYIQGYYFARPMPQEEYIEFLRENNF